jgi:hypothetical protein
MTTPQTEHRDSGMPAALTRIRGEIRDLVDTLWAARGPAELMHTVAEIESLKSTLDAVELGVVNELEATGSVKPVGWASTQDFHTSVAGGTKPRAQRPSASPALSPSR